MYLHTALKSQQYLKSVADDRMGELEKSSKEQALALDELKRRVDIIFSHVNGKSMAESIKEEGRSCWVPLPGTTSSGDRGWATNLLEEDWPEGVPLAKILDSMSADIIRQQQQLAGLISRGVNSVTEAQTPVAIDPPEQAGADVFTRGALTSIERVALKDGMSRREQPSANAINSDELELSEKDAMSRAALTSVERVALKEVLSRREQQLSNVMDDSEVASPDVDEAIDQFMNQPTAAPLRSMNAQATSLRTQSYSTAGRYDNRCPEPKTPDSVMCVRESSDQALQAWVLKMLAGQESVSLDLAAQMTKDFESKIGDLRTELRNEFVSFQTFLQRYNALVAEMESLRASKLAVL